MIVILGYCLIMGFFRGLINELSAICGVIGGFFAAYAFYSPVAGWLSRTISDPAYRKIISFFIIFIIIIVLVGITTLIVKYLLKTASFGWLDRISGAAFGTIKGIMIISIILLVLTAFLQKGSPLIKDSVMSPRVTLISEKIAVCISKEMKRQYQLNVKELKKIWKIH